jgi:hypothetical protein
MAAQIAVIKASPRLQFPLDYFISVDCESLDWSVGSLKMANAKRGIMCVLIILMHTPTKDKVKTLNLF